ncbi:MAG: alpha/beta hydrolase [Nitriliruptoraceae bacterium]|nr:alpha/beta hydrolase [Nitriliruptoraceae bacterium]
MDPITRHRVQLSGVPDGPAMVFAHGYGCDQHVWRHVAPAFEHDHLVVRFDHAGAGGTPADEFDFARHETLDGYANDVVDLLTALDLEAATFVGHSVSGSIGVLASIRAPERIGRLVLLGPSPRYLDDEGYVGGFRPADIDGLLATIERNELGWTSGLAQTVAGADGPVSEELDASFCRTDPRIAYHFARTTFLADNRHDLAQVPVPTLVVQVAIDAIAPVEVGRYVDAALPDSSLTVLDTVGHAPHLSDPALTIEAIRSWV